VGTVMVHLSILVFSMLFCKSNHSAAGYYLQLYALSLLNLLTLRLIHLFRGLA
jgi:hypothetical protein